MTGRWRVAALLGGAAVLAAGCGGTPAHSLAASARVPPAPASVSLDTAQTSASGTWAAIPMGTSGPDQFWQLFRLPPAGGSWALQTPPDIATNGALVLAPQDGPGKAAQALVTGVRPSQYLTFSPVTVTADDGAAWHTLPPEAGLADVPDALAAAPDGHLIALGTGQRLSVLSPGGSGWTALSGPSGCAPAVFTAVAYAADGTPLLGGACDRGGVAGVFAYGAGTWRRTSLTLPATLAGQPVRVLRLTRTGRTDTAVLGVGTGRDASLLAAWTSDDGQRWTVSPALRLAGGGLVSVSFGAGGRVAVALAGNRGATIAGGQAAWAPLSPLPAGKAVTLALPTAGITEALVASGGTLTVWRHGAGTAGWAKAQTLAVPIQYGSSG